MSQRVTTDVAIGRMKGDITYLPVFHSVYQSMRTIVTKKTEINNKQKPMSQMVKRGNKG